MELNQFVEVRLTTEDIKCLIAEGLQLRGYNVPLEDIQFHITERPVGGMFRDDYAAPMLVGCTVRSVIK